MCIRDSPKLDTTAIIRQDLENLARSGVVSGMKNNKNVQIILPKQNSGILKQSTETEEVKIDMPEAEATS